jgi:hypothetical protein
MNLVQDHSTEDETLLHYCTPHECIIIPEHEQSFPKGDTTYLPTYSEIDRTSTHGTDMALAQLIQAVPWISRGDR